MSELWKPVCEYEGIYEISDLGNVKSLRTNKLLKPFMNTRKYYQIGLSKGGKIKNFYVHRLVAAAFLGEIYDQVDHIDGDKNNNKVSNLRLCTKRENQNFYCANDYPGATYSKSKEKWMACISIGNKNKTLGYFSNPLDASNRYLQELKKLENNRDDRQTS